MANQEEAGSGSHREGADTGASSDSLPLFFHDSNETRSTTTTIRDAWAHDRALIERMAEEGKLDRIHRQLPSMQSHFARHSTKTLPGVISSWWKYAYVNVVNEIQQGR